MTQERDDYMRRQEQDHDLLRMRDPTRSISAILQHVYPPQPMPTAALRYLENDPCDEMMPPDLEVIKLVSIHPTWEEDLYQRLANVWGVPRPDAKERAFRILYGG